MDTLKGLSRPVPVIENESSFSRKKKSGLLKESSATPKSPMKSAPPVSRIFHKRKRSTGACAISFRESEVNVQSPLYTNFDRLYFDQCFTELSFLGSGSFGQVVKVQSKEDGKLYAIKRSRQRFRNDFDRTQQLEEVNKNEQIKVHPNCVRFYKAWEECDHLYIQTELCDMSLKDYAESVQVIGEKEIWKIIVDLCRGLKHLHDAQLVHMDIKPANLFLGRDGMYKIGDFGLVVELARDLSDAMDGDSKYLAPELMEGNVSKAVDIFSLGITILELACSLELPHGGLLWHQLRNNKLPLEFTQGLSDDLIILISNMMDRNPIYRPTVTDIINRPCVLETCQERLGRKQLSHRLSQYLFIFFQFIFKMFSLFFNLFKTKPNCDKFKISIPPSKVTPTSHSVNDDDSCHIGHKSLQDNVCKLGHESPCYSPAIFKGKDGVPISPVFGRDSLFQPISNKREMDTWEVKSPEIISPTPRSYSTPRQKDRSPQLSPVSDHAVRSKLFNCSDEEDIFDPHSLSTNLLNAFNESEQWD